MQKILVAGIGGVGGYFGGLLAKHDLPGGTGSVHFFARGENEKAIRENGLQFETTKGNFTVHPASVSSDASATGPVDLLIICTKSYDLEDSLQQLRPCIGKETVILPLLNGVESPARIRKLYPENETWEGCVYLVSRLAAPGLIRETGGIDKLFFGSANGTRAKLEAALHLFRTAGIDASLSENIHETTWEKFIFISAVAGSTSLLDKTTGEVMHDANGLQLVEHLLEEVICLARAKGILLPETIGQQTLEKIRAIPAGSTSSMHSDFRKGGKTELESLTGYVVRESQLLGLHAPVSGNVYETLLRRNSTANT
jgi:2-dehydropantoate 2-reductase